MPRYKMEDEDKPKELKNDAPKFIHAKGWLRDLIVIHRQEGAGGIAPVFVQLNNFACHIPREVECLVSKPIVQTLREAIATQTYKDEKGADYSRDITKYNFEIKAANVNWDEVMNDKDHPEYAKMNEDYLKSIGKWDKERKVA